MAIIPPTDDQLYSLLTPYTEYGPPGPGPAFMVGYAGQGFSGIYSAGTVMNMRQQAMPLTNDTPFEIASNSKIFTALLYESLLPAWHLGPPMVADFPLLNIGRQFAQIPLSSLMNYTSGLPADNDAGAADFPRFLPAPYAQPAMLGYMNFSPLQVEPAGQNYTYSNLGFALMAAIAPMIAGGSTYEQLVADIIFGPLGMSSTSFFDDVRLDQLPLGINFDGTAGTPVSAGWEFFPAYNGAGGVVSTANDMLTWLQFNMGLSTNSALSPLLPVMQAQSTGVTTPWGDNLGVGWFLNQGDHYDTIWKDGDLNGFSSFMAIAPSTDPGSTTAEAGVFVLTNSNGIVGPASPPAPPPVICSYIAYSVLDFMHQVSPTGVRTYPSSKPRGVTARR